METIAQAPTSNPEVARLEAARALQAAASNGTAKAASKTTQGGEFLTFRLGEEEYGIDILRVQEIRSYETPTRIANAPAFVKGVVNLRGVIVPIIDLRLKLACAAAEYNTFTVVVVLNVRGRVVGAVVDSVSDVLALKPDDIKAAPELNSSVDASYITGIGTIKEGQSQSDGYGNQSSAKGADTNPDRERMLILMDIEGLMSSTDMGLISH
jgi:purine-binding chemotaxis protein CheW